MVVIISEIFDVAGREHGEPISSQDLVNELNMAGEKATFAKDLNTTAELIQQKLAKFDVVLMMGAGDIGAVSNELAQHGLILEKEQ